MNQSGIEFGTTIPGEEATKKILFQNLGNQQLSITNITSSNPVFNVLNSSDITLDFGNIMELEVQFNSAESGSFSSEIIFNTNDPNNSEVAIPVSINNFTYPEITYPNALEAEIGRAHV